jgi:hypothetical protein
VPQYLLGKQRKLCGSGKKYLAWRKHHVAQAKKLQKINVAIRQRPLNRYSQNAIAFSNDISPGMALPPVKNRRAYDPYNRLTRTRRTPILEEENDKPPPGGFPMNKDALHAKLEELRTQLAGVSALDEKTHAQLRSLVEDIEHAIQTDGDDANGKQSSREQALSGQAEDLVLKFETEHPQLTSALNQVAIALSNLGI